MFLKVAWIVTFLGVVIFDVDIGLYIGIGVSLLLVIVKTQR
jgi:MFS superfamily sulfate permease-like transporter